MFWNFVHGIVAFFQLVKSLKPTLKIQLTTDLIIIINLPAQYTRTQARTHVFCECINVWACAYVHICVVFGVDVYEAACFCYNVKWWSEAVKKSAKQFLNLGKWCSLLSANINYDTTTIDTVTLHTLFIQFSGINSYVITGWAEPHPISERRGKDVYLSKT